MHNFKRRNIKGTSIFVSNSTLDDKEKLFPTSLVLLCTISVIFSLHHLKTQESSKKRKVTGARKIPVVVFKNINLDFTPIIADLFNGCFKERDFLSLRMSGLKVHG